MEIMDFNYTSLINIFNFPTSWERQYNKSSFILLYIKII